MKPSVMDMGLDEIIKSKKKGKNFPAKKIGGGGRGGRIGGGGGGVRRRGKTAGAPPLVGGRRIVDARMKIIEKTRAKMRDARERLIQLARSSDARTRISPKVGRNGIMGLTRGGGLGFVSDRTPLPRRTIRNQNASALTYRRDQMVYRTVKNPRGLVEDENVMDVDDEEWSMAGRLQIHLHNSSAGLHPATHLRSATQHPTGLRSSMSSDDSWLRPGPNKQTVYRGRDDVKSRLEPVSRGLPVPTQNHEGFRIVVSNLQPTVTHEDIKELFEDIGVLVGSRVVRPGTAEVVYKNMDDALAAVDTYHNRQLDGQPMKCMLVKPSNVPSKGFTGTKGSIVPDLHAIHKALFNK